MTYKKENNLYIFTNCNGETIFSSPIIALLTNKGKIVEHGPANIIRQKYVQLMTSSQYSVVESDEFDTVSLNQMIGNIQPTIK